MSYTALKEMKEKLQAEFNGVEMGPKSPMEIKVDINQKVDFKTAVAHFVHERCTDLRFSEKIAQNEKQTGVLKGKSSRDGQIPYNMQMDIDRLCLARSIERFMESGCREDAFDVYFCFLEMFGGGYSTSRRMIELLSEYESTASTMLMSHRDHYSHSVYVFLLGVAMFDSIPIVRNEYKRFYKIKEDRTAAHHFLQFWGMTALFHDIGYPFEISFEQITSYFSQRNEENDRVEHTKNMPFVCYGNMNSYLRIDKQAKLKLKDWYNRNFKTFEEWLAFDIVGILRRSNCARVKDTTEQDVIKILKNVARPARNKKFMDHAYFSSIILFKEFFEALDNENSKNPLKKEHMDALTAIALHNSLYKRELTGDNKLKLDDHAFMIEWHPLAYLLQLADELQCWDRTSYGRNTRAELHSMSCNLKFDENGVYAEYVYDKAESKKIVDYWNKYREYEALSDIEKKTRLKKYSDMVNDNVFAKEIGRVVGLSNYGSCNGNIKLNVSVRIENVEQKKKCTYLSTSNFIHIYDFAAALNAQYNKNFEQREEMLDDFELLSLEYKLSNIGQAKNFAKALDEIGCFYTDRPVAYEMVKCFTNEELLCLGDFEHKRWEKEKHEMCWMPGGNIENKLKENKNELREMARMHYDLDVKFDDLNDEEKLKDISQLNTMMDKLLEFDGIRVYRYR